MPFETIPVSLTSIQGLDVHIAKEGGGVFMGDILGNNNHKVAVECVVHPEGLITPEWHESFKMLSDGMVQSSAVPDGIVGPVWDVFNIFTWDA